MNEMMFPDEIALADFVAAFLKTGSTHIFTTKPCSPGGYILTFTGGC